MVKSVDKDGTEALKHVAAFVIYIFIYIYIYVRIYIHSLVFRPSAGLAGTRAQSGDRYGSGTLHLGQVLRGRLLLLSPRY
jgi:hypothetical protein